MFMLLCLLLNALKMEKWVRKSTLSSRSDSIPMGSWSIMMLGVLGGMLASQTAWATKEPYTEEASNRPICRVNVVKANGKAHLIEYVFQNVKQSKNTTPFWIQGKPLQEDYCKGSTELYGYGAQDIQAAGASQLTVWGADGRKRVEGSYGENGDKIGTWTTYSNNGAIDTKTAYPKKSNEPVQYESWREDGSMVSRQFSEIWSLSIQNESKKVKSKTAHEICDIKVLKQEKGMHLIEFVFANKTKNTTPYWTVDTPLKRDYCRDARFVTEGSYDAFVRRASKFVIWDQQGKKVADGNYNRFGRREGMWSTYYPNGQMKSTQDKDTNRSYQSWYANGQLKSEVENGVMGGIAKYWNQGNRSSQPDKTVKTTLHLMKESTEKIFNKQGKLVAYKKWDLTRGSRLVVNETY